MANEEQLRILREQGVEAWNTWRRQKVRQLDLRGAELSGADLSLANLRRVNFSEANLRRVNLSLADLRRANLIEANLRRANLSLADLRRANLIEADFRAANLTGAKLVAANLREADLCGADLRGADLRASRFFETILSNVDLSGCKNLDAVQHDGPSTIDIRTLQRSGPLPLAFLRGVGLPDKLINDLPSLLGQPSPYYSCFISYASKNDEFVQRLHADLQGRDVRCWIAPEDMKIGAKILDTLDEAIHLRDKVLLILSEASIASDWVEDEVTKAFAEERQRGGVVLFPVRLDDTVFTTKEAWALKLRDNRHIGDFRAWKDQDAYQKAFERVLRDLRVETT